MKHSKARDIKGYNMNESQKELVTNLKNVFDDTQLQTNTSLAKYCNWKVGGVADILLIVKNTNELTNAVRLSQSFNQPVTIIGYGANILVSDDGVRGLVILNRAQNIIFHSNDLVEVESGTNLAFLAKKAAAKCISGLEILIGIPGTIGGAIYGNAGTRDKWISDLLVRVDLLGKNGQIYSATPAELRFSYRTSRLKLSGEIVLSAVLRGYKDDQTMIKNKMRELLEMRKNQPGGPSVGSVFKNPEGHFAGRLIEQCGLKGYQIRGAKISEKHANFILNQGGATAKDIISLIKLIQTEVQNNFGIQLIEEIQYLGDGFEEMVS